MKNPRPARVFEVHLRLVCTVEAGSEEEAADIALDAASWIGDNPGDEQQRISVCESIVDSVQAEEQDGDDEGEQCG